ncbi:hypothetical protein SteCoe_21601 [Stentor coeruleus]|uniref:PX domain-containing protein n=1 Tax=Stentor coeruleus TaxID=5963 RepID=A0A1R2BPA4_9CILI|nr:hypothetical protein SteCoe_21601 [Stentor coeruleus]
MNLNLIIYSVISAGNILAFITTLALSLKKQKVEQESITITHTKSHLIKLILATSNLLVSVAIFIIDICNKNIENIVENTSYTFLWLFSIMILRREFIRIGKTSLVLIIFWFIILLLPLSSFLLSILENNSEYHHLRNLLILIIILFNCALIVFCLIRTVDVRDVYTRTSTTYQQMLKSYFIEDESLEDSRKDLSVVDDAEEKDKSIFERENIKKIVIKETKNIEDGSGIDVCYVIEICYGKTKNLMRKVMRRFREFIEMFYDLKKYNPRVVFPEFPVLTINKEDLTEEIIRNHGIFFNELFDIIISRRLRSQVLDKFLSNTNESEYIKTNPKDRVMSTVFETVFTVNISKTKKDKHKFVSQTIYEITVSCGKFSITTHHYFSDFKSLRKSLKNSHENIIDLPKSHLTKSSINPKVVEERKIKLAEFLQYLLDTPEFKTDPEVVNFLKLDAITGFSDNPVYQDIEKIGN